MLLNVDWKDPSKCLLTLTLTMKDNDNLGSVSNADRSRLAKDKKCSYSEMQTDPRRTRIVYGHLSTLLILGAGGDVARKKKQKKKLGTAWYLCFPHLGRSLLAQCLPL